MLIKSIEEIIDKYDTYFIDIWGVMHNGFAAFPDAIKALNYLKFKNKNIIFITNSPNRSSFVKASLAKKNINDHLYECIVSSGEVFYHYITENDFELKNYFAFNISSDNDILINTKFNRVLNIEEAEFIIIQGPNNIKKDLKLLDKIFSHEKKIFCVNPDIHVICNGQKIFCAGYLAKYCESKGVDVFYFGKPHNLIYEECLKYTNADKNKILAIGDNILTDIKGANAFGIDSLLVLSGVENEFNNDIKSNYVMEKISC